MRSRVWLVLSVIVMLVGFAGFVAAVLGYDPLAVTKAVPDGHGATVYATNSPGGYIGMVVLLLGSILLAVYGFARSSDRR